MSHSEHVGRRFRRLATAGLVLVTTLALLVPGAAASAEQEGFAPVDRPGPPLTVQDSVLAGALSCSPGVRGAKRDPVLLVPGTGGTPETVFGWNFLPAFKAGGVPYCAVTLPREAVGDIQVAAEYVVHAVRAMHADSGRRVQMLGWSQGAGPAPRWALRWWPDLRPMVNGLIAIDPPNRGSVAANALGCGLVNAMCSPAVWQQRSGSDFVGALNSRAMTFPEVKYTVIYTRIDTLNQPNLNGYAATLPNGPNVRNVALQDVCLSAVALGAEHAQTLGNAVTNELVMDALNHPGAPADPDRIDPAACARLGQPHSDLVAQTLGISNLYGNALTVGIPRDAVDAEPPLRCYVYSSEALPRRCLADEA
ncbi:esterase/lipase family protein [Amycolatopsis sp. NPDC059090]|uniref:esterase/lipase family protein n=1 Tax=unclassified Amycolatopsis TaxID=2618356 RepID=UPI00366CC75A